MSTHHPGSTYTDARRGGLGQGRRTNVQGATVVKAAACGITPLILALAALGGLGSFATVRDMAQPWFGDLAWIVPVGMDLGILILLAWDLLMEYVTLPCPVLRWVAWFFIGSTVAVNVMAAHGDTAGALMHAAMPALFITVIEGVRHLIRQWVGLATGTRIERIPTARWLLAPVSTALLWRRIVLWHVPTYREALAVELRHLTAVSQLQQQHGRWAWRWRAPLAERVELRRLPAVAVGYGDDPYDGPFAGREDESGWLSAGPTARSEEGKSSGADDEAAAELTTRTHSQEPNGADDELLRAATALIADGHQRGRQLSILELGRQLRKLGFTISNGRIAALRAVASAEEPSELPDYAPEADTATTNP